MEILIGICNSIIGKAVEYTFEPATRQIGYFFQYKRNVDNLKTQIEDLKFIKERIQHSVDTARRNCEEIEGDVQNWLGKVETIFDEAEKLLLRDEAQANTGCSNGSFGILINKYKLSKQAKKKTQIIAQVKEEGNFSKVSYRLAPKNSFKIKGYETFETRAGTIMDIMKALRDDGVHMIGVWGMGGVGKTMLVKEVARQAKSENLFTHVVLTSLSQAPDSRKVQEEVAETLGLRLEENSISMRANRLKDFLRKEKNILIILDDVWSKLDLESIGISFADGQKGCKIVLTSRSEDVLRNEMGANKSFKLGILNDFEAANLFNHIVGDMIEENELPSLKDMILKKCAGLPLAIFVVANALKNKGISIWKDALHELRASNPVNIKGVEKELYSVIKLSYNFLESPEAKSLLLLCSLYEEDKEIDINELATYGMGLRLFDRINKLKDARHRVSHLVENLKTSSLLLDGSMGNYVKMHDVIRDVILSIASKDRHMYFISNVELNEMLHNEELKNTTAISCLINDINDPLPERLSFPKLQLLSLINSRLHDFQIPIQFFEGENKLQVLHLDDVMWNLSSSPTFQFLKNLRALIFSGHLQGDTTLIGELTSLEILNMSNSDLKAVPTQFGKLTRLRSLNLSNCRDLKFIAHGVISSLELLEEFSMKQSFTRWAACEEVNGESNNASLDEVKQLKHLTTLHLDIENAHNVIPHNLFTDKLEKYEVVIDAPLFWRGDRNHVSRFLVVNGLSYSLLEHSGLENLIINVEALFITEPKGLDNFLLESSGGLTQLKVLRLKNISTFQHLEEMYIEKLTNLETLCDGTDSFPKLRVIDVKDCHSLKNLFPLSAACSKLEKIRVSYCDALEGIFTNNKNHGEVKEMTEFPRLRSIQLKNLPMLMRFCDEFPTIQKGDKRQLNSLSNNKVMFPKLKDVFVWGCNSLKSLFPASIAKGLRQLESLKIYFCYKMQEIVAKDEGAKDTIPKFDFLQLTTLTLDSLPQLECLYPGLHSSECPCLSELKLSSCGKIKILASQLLTFKENTSEETHAKTPLFLMNTVMFPKLKEVSVEGCHSLKSLFPASIAKGLNQLESLEIHVCYKMKEVVAKDEGAKDTIPKFDFLKLTTLKLFRLPELECLYPGLHSSEWPSLSELDLFRCGKIKILASKLLAFNENTSEETHAKTPLFLMNTVTFPSLRELKIYDCESMSEVIVDAPQQDEKVKLSTSSDIVFTRLEYLNLTDLPKLTCFYKGHCALTFPELRKFYVFRCREMRSFSSEAVETPMLKAISIYHFEEGRYWEGDVNTTLQKRNNSTAKLVKLIDDDGGGGGAAAADNDDDDVKELANMSSYSGSIKGSGI